MKITVSYSELVSGPGYNNRQARAEIEQEVNGNLDEAFENAWNVCKREVGKQLQPEQVPYISIDDDTPF